MYNFHSDGDRYFEIQKLNCKENVIPFIEEVYAVKCGTRVLEIGCGSGGVLSAFIERGCIGAGIDIREESIGFAKEKIADNKDVILLVKDIYDVDVEECLNGKFDIIILKDVIEHLPDKERLMKQLKRFVSDKGVIFFGFPPWQMPFGGHQQMLQSRILSRMPYFHLLPMPVYKYIMRIFGDYSEELVEIKNTGISIEQFERIAKKVGFVIIKRQLHLINPIYKYKLGLKKRLQYGFISAIPFVCNFFTTSVFYIIKPNK
ncbi:MAG: class I SAM-dependent methyltransferase [Dysgonamonadaceae bacterium]|jgi:2-polyprenyl-3-methyl-5-hydroxy-6-metoxy-1,4-benzoquinol methylase|nr:class I SAM-dependent methyltransferase [Dysgonamonadaceae bacterium]